MRGEKKFRRRDKHLLVLAGASDQQVFERNLRLIAGLSLGKSKRRIRHDYHH